MESGKERKGEDVERKSDNDDKSWVTSAKENVSDMMTAARHDIADKAKPTMDTDNDEDSAGKGEYPSDSDRDRTRKSDYPADVPIHALADEDYTGKHDQGRGQSKGQGESGADDKPSGLMSAIRDTFSGFVSTPKQDANNAAGREKSGPIDKDEKTPHKDQSTSQATDSERSAEDKQSAGIMSSIRDTFADMGIGSSKRDESTDHKDADKDSTARDKDPNAKVADSKTKGTGETAEATEDSSKSGGIMSSLRDTFAGMVFPGSGKHDEKSTGGEREREHEDSSQESSIRNMKDLASSGSNDKQVSDRSDKQQQQNDVKPSDYATAFKDTIVGVATSAKDKVVGDDSSKEDKSTSEAAKEKTDETTSAAKAKADEQTSAAKEKASDVASAAEEKGKAAKDKTAETLTSTKDSAEDQGEAAKEKVADAKDTAMDKGRENKEAAKEKVDDVKDSAAEQGEAAKEKVTDAKDSAMDKGTENKDRAADTSRQAASEVADYSKDPDKDKDTSATSSSQEQSSDMMTSAKEAAYNLSSRAKENIFGDDQPNENKSGSKNGDEGSYGAKANLDESHEDEVSETLPKMVIPALDTLKTTKESTSPIGPGAPLSQEVPLAVPKRVEWKWGAGHHPNKDLTPKNPNIK